MRFHCKQPLHIYSSTWELEYPTSNLSSKLISLNRCNLDFGHAEPSASFLVLLRQYTCILLLFNVLEALKTKLS